MPSQPSESTSSSARLKRFSILGLTMIIVVIPFCLYYLFYVSSQEDYFSNRNFRVLAAIGEHINSKIDGLATNLVFVAEKATQDIRKRKAGKKDDVVSEVRDAAMLVRAFKGDQVTYKPVRGPAAGTARSNQRASNPGSIPSKGLPGAAPGAQSLAKTDSAAAVTQPVTMSIRADEGSYWLYLECLGPSKELSGTLSVMNDIKKHFEPFVAPYVIDELNETKERLFDEVLVAEQETGRVIFQRGAAGLSVVALDSFSNNKGGKLEVDLADQSSTLANVQLAGTDYKLFLQPVRLTHTESLDNKQLERRWVVCGLTRKDHFRDETFAISYTVLTVFIFMVLLTALGWPLLKLKLMGPKDRMRRRDLRLTLLSALAGMALVTFMLLDVHTYFTLENTLDHNLLRLSEKIQLNFREEVTSALAQLRQFNCQITALARDKQPGVQDQKCAKAPQLDDRITSWARNDASKVLKELSESTTSPRPEPANTTPPYSGITNIFANGIEWKAAPYPYFNTATWTDPSGQQRIKWTTWDDTTAFVKVSSREFFRKAKYDKLWRLDQTSPDSDYWVELLRSRLTGENVAVIATRVPDSSWVSNLDTRLLSLMGTVLPSPFGYAVIDNDGKVIFHSDEVKNLEEQFFAECENDRELRAAVMSRADRLIDSKYLGKGHRLYSSPLSGTPWTLVVFVDKQMARTIKLEVITLSIVLYVVFALLVVALTSLFFLARRTVLSGRYQARDGDWTTLLWPVPEYARRYELLIQSYVLLACIFVLALVIGDGFVATCCIVLPLLAGFLWLLTLCKPYRKANTVPTSYRTRYAIALTALLILMSVLPAAGFFQIAQNFETRLLVKYGQVSIAKGLEQRAQRVTLQYASIKIGGQGDRAPESKQQDYLLAPKLEKNAFLNQRLDLSSDEQNLDVYDSFLFGTRAIGVGQLPSVDQNPGGIDSMLAWIRPLYNQSCVESQELSRGASSDRLWQWKQDAAGRTYLEKDKDGRVGDPSVVLKSDVGALVTPNTPWSWIRVTLSIALLLLLPYGLVRFVAKRFFLLEMDPTPYMDPPLYIDLPLRTDLRGNYVYIRSSLTADGNKWDEKKYDIFDLRGIKDWRNLIGQLTKTDAPPEVAYVTSGGFLKSELVAKCEAPLKLDKLDKGVVFDNFEYCMDDPAASREKLLAIEYFLEAKRPFVVVASTVEPLNFSFIPKPSGPVGATAAQFSLLVAPQPAAPGSPTNGKGKTIASSHVSTDGKENGAASQNGKPRVADPLPTGVQARWTEVFTKFAIVFADEQSRDDFCEGYPDGFLCSLKTKRPWRYIEGIGRGIALSETPQNKNCHDRAYIEEQIGQVAEQAQSYHKALWETCTEGQRCTLIQLAQEGMISPTNKHLRRLLKRQLVVRDPALRLMDESFRRFVSSVSHKEDVEAWQQQEGGSAWQLLKAPLLLILISVALFLFITQKDTYDSTVTFMSALAGGITALFKLLGMLHGKDKGVGAIPG
ncbi:MAG TPA: cache domain-containing protein [Blastocatellia bacterium]|nr:cache domain-containing protein [Blastocatellia bacterium]